MESDHFYNRCYQLLKRVPAGRVTTYKEVARGLGTRAYRAVGNAMASNRDFPVVPCHRVVRSNGEIGGYALGRRKKIERLAEEGIVIRNGSVLDFDSVLYRFVR